MKESAQRPYVMRARARLAAETGERILTATAALFAEVPYAQLTLGAVAERAGVTAQTVLRRFGDKEGLVAAAAARETATVAAERGLAPVGDPAGAVANLVDHYERYGGIALRLLSEERSSATIGRLAEQGRQLHREWCERVFAPTLSGLSGQAHERRLAQLVAVCDVQVWALLRHDAGLSRDQTAIALVEMLEPLTGRP